MSLYPTVLGRTTMPKKAPARPKPLTDMQVAQQQLDPVVKRVTDAINQRAQAAANAVRGYTGSLAQQLASTDYASPYRSAIPQQAAVDAALQQSLAGRGNELAQGLQSRLASIQEPGAVNPATANVAQIGVGAGNTELARGSAALSALLANQAAAGEYGAKQPGIAKFAGLQGLGRVQGQAVSDIASQTAPLYGKLPDIVSGIQTNRARRQQLALENKLAGKKATAAAAPRPDASLSRAYGYAVDQYGNPVGGAVTPLPGYQTGPNGTVVKTPKPPPALKPPKPLSTSDRRAALKAADLYFYGQQPVTRADGTVSREGVPGINYAQAVKQLMVGYGLTRAQAVELANTYYKTPGERGRPRTAAQKKTQAAVDSGLGIPHFQFGP